MNDKRAISKKKIFLIFWFSNIAGLLWSKITIFIIEISLKLHLQTKYGWNNPNWGRLGLKSRKLHFFAISGSLKFIAYTNIQIHVTGSIFILIWFFFKMLVTMSSIRLNNNWKVQKTPFYGSTIPLKYCYWSSIMATPSSIQIFLVNKEEHQNQ